MGRRKGREAGYFPFYLSVILAAASIYGAVTALLRIFQESGTFVTRDQLRRVPAGSSCRRCCSAC